MLFSLEKVLEKWALTPAVKHLIKSHALTFQAEAEIPDDCQCHTLGCAGVNDEYFFFYYFLVDLRSNPHEIYGAEIYAENDERGFLIDTYIFKTPVVIKKPTPQKVTYPVKNTPANRHLFNMFDLINKDKQAFVVRNKTLYLINRSDMKPKTDLWVTDPQDIIWE